MKQIAQILYKKILFFTLLFGINAQAQSVGTLSNHTSSNSIFLRSYKGYGGNYKWQMKKAADIHAGGSEISSPSYKATQWLYAQVPGTVLNTLVKDSIYPDPYYGDQNRKTRNLIPDIKDVGTSFYEYWFRTSFTIPREFKGKQLFLKFHGINYRCEIWLNSQKLGDMAGMFNSQAFNISTIANLEKENILSVKVTPVDFPGSGHRNNKDTPGAVGENKNGGDGKIGKNVTMMMSVGWDFTAPDGIRDRNTGIWRDVELYATGDVELKNAFIKTDLSLPDTTSVKQTVSVEITNNTSNRQQGVLKGTIKEESIRFEKKIWLRPNETKEVAFSPEEYEQLTMKNPKLWWPLNKGEQNLYHLNLKFIQHEKVSHQITVPYGVREVMTDRNTPDKSRRFLVNGYPVFIRGSNWIPEAMLKNSEERTYAELRYTKEAGINFLRLWGGGIAESDEFYRLCDEMGIMVWSEFWITGNTEFPVDTTLYFRNMTSTIKRIRNHPSAVYYVSANESTEIEGAAALINRLDGTRGYQPQSECCGIHDGSPYKYVNPMQYFENTASERGSRIDGFNPEYGTLCLPVYESLKKMMPEDDLWPINKKVWDYMDGGGFHKVTTRYKDAVDEFGVSSSAEEFSGKAQAVGAMGYRSIWEVWNYNKFNNGDRFTSGFLFWYHNSPLPQTSARLYDWFLHPTAALYYTKNALKPLHPQFDYLKNTVSVYNDYRKEFDDYNIEAEIYNFNSKRVLQSDKKINIPADGVVNDAIKIDFPEDISQIHFIKLTLKDEKGIKISDAFYWRSNDKYEGAWTNTGPAVSGFQDMGKLPETELSLETNYTENNGRYFIKAKVTNAGAHLSFFTRLNIKDEKGKSVLPAFYSDNYFALLPKETKTIIIEVPKENLILKNAQIELKSWNTDSIKINGILLCH